MLQRPADRYRCHYIKAKVLVSRRLDNHLAIFHGPRLLACYDAQGKHVTQVDQAAALRGDPAPIKCHTFSK